MKLTEPTYLLGLHRMSLFSIDAETGFTYALDFKKMTRTKVCRFTLISLSLRQCFICLHSSQTAIFTTEALHRNHLNVSFYYIESKFSSK